MIAALVAQQAAWSCSACWSGVGYSGEMVVSTYAGGVWSSTCCGGSSYVSYPVMAWNTYPSCGYASHWPGYEVVSACEGFGTGGSYGCGSCGGCESCAGGGGGDGTAAVPTGRSSARVSPTADHPVRVTAGPLTAGVVPGVPVEGSVIEGGVITEQPGQPAPQRDPAVDVPIRSGKRLGHGTALPGGGRWRVGQ